MKCLNPNCEQQDVTNRWKFCIGCGAAIPQEDGTKHRSYEVEKNDEEIKTYKNQISDLNQQLDNKETLVKTLNEKLKADKSLLNNEITRLNAEKTEILKNQPNTKFRQKYIISIVFIVILCGVALFFAIKVVKLSFKNSSLEQRISHIENRVIPPLQSAQDFTPQRYKSVVDRCYFYDYNFNKTKNYILYGEELKIVRIKDNFAYGIYTDKKGTTTSGWVRKGDVVQ